MVLPSLFIIVPMYMYPSPGPPSVWSTLFNSIASTPSVNWRIIVNPDSGPGAGIYPDSNYVSAIAQLNTYTNVQTLGYVHTSYGARPLANVTADIATYAGWSSYSNGNSKPDIHVDGIFLDESPVDTQYLSYMSQVSSYAKQKMTKGNFTMFNTGCNTPVQFYQYTNAVNAYETSYTISPSIGQNSALAAIPSSLRNTSTVMIHTYTNTTAQLAIDTAALMAENIAGLFITTKPSYGTYSAGWTQFVKDVAANVAKS